MAAVDTYSTFGRGVDPPWCETLNRTAEISGQLQSSIRSRDTRIASGGAPNRSAHEQQLSMLGQPTAAMQRVRSFAATA